VHVVVVVAAAAGGDDDDDALQNVNPSTPNILLSLILF